MQLLDISPQQGFHVLLRILCNLLELVNGNETRSVCMRKICEDFFERLFCLLGIKRESKLWKTR